MLTETWLIIEWLWQAPDFETEDAAINAVIARWGCSRETAIEAVSFGPDVLNSPAFGLIFET